MFTFEGKCPHCRSDRGFNAFGISEYIIVERDLKKMHASEAQAYANRYTKNPDVEFSLAGNCIACRKPVVATCEATKSIRDEIAKHLFNFDVITRQYVKVKAIYPPAEQPYTHVSLPEPVRESFVDLQNMLHEKKRPHFIIMGCRTVLEAAVRNLKGEGDTLYARIEDLFNRGVITSSLKEWASVIRKTGNEATHEMRGTEEEARELVNFTKVFLQFTFELPATISALQNV